MAAHAHPCAPHHSHSPCAAGYRRQTEAVVPPYSECHQPTVCSMIAAPCFSRKPLNAMVIGESRLSRR